MHHMHFRLIYFNIILFLKNIQSNIKLFTRHEICNIIYLVSKFRLLVVIIFYY